MSSLFAIHFQSQRPALRLMAGLALVVSLCHCANTSSIRDADVVVSVPDQKLGFYRDGNLVQSYKVSTSKFGVGDDPGSCRTPLGKHEVVAKIGHGLPQGAVLKSRQWNGEVLKPNAPGRDPVVSRIMWLSGLESDNHNALRRFIYIHGTTEENRLGKPASYGCVRMSMSDVISLFNKVQVGAKVVITKEHLPSHEQMVAAETKPAPSPASMPATPRPSSNPPIDIQSGEEGPRAIHSEYQPGGPVQVEPTKTGKQRLLIPVGHSLSKAEKKEKDSGKKQEAAATSKSKREVTAKTAKKGEPTAKKRKTDTAA